MWKHETPRHDADDRGLSSVDADCFADHLCSTVLPLPQAVADNCNRKSPKTIFVRSERATKDRTNTQRGKQVPGTIIANADPFRCGACVIVRDGHDLKPV